MHPLRRWAFILTGVSMALFAALALASYLLPGAPNVWSAYGLMVLAGGPACFLAGALVAVWQERLGVTLLWLGSAVASLGLALRSGPYVGRYFAGMALIVLPQLAVAALLTAHAKAAERAAEASKKGK
jgi:hypothetical protein